MGTGRILGISVVTALVLAALGACGSDDSPGENPPPGEDGGLPDGQLPPPVRAEFGLDTRPANPTCKAPARPPSTAPVAFEEVYQTVNLGTPMMMAQIPGNSSKWYVAQRNGNIVSFPTVSPGATPDVLGNVGTLEGTAVQQGGEGGLLGMAFHPNFAANGRLYVTWVKNAGPIGFQSEVGYVRSLDGGVTFTEYTRILGPFNQPATNHNGGGIAFGKDGFLYLSFGDGGGGNDQFDNGQTKTGFFSKVLRIDVDNVPGGETYGIPNDNPFKNGGGEPATFAYGFRNPFRFSIDRDTGEVWVGDVGQNHWEEIDLVKLGGNYGWPCREGAHDHLTNKAGCPPTTAGLADPVVDLEHTNFPPGGTRSLTGGVVYRGKAIPNFAGTYLFGDYEAQEIYTVTFDTTTGAATATQIADAPTAPWVAFAEDNDGEVYGVGLNGTMYKMVAKPGAPPSTFPDRLSKTGCADGADVKKPAAGLIPYGVISSLWSDGAAKDRFFALPNGTNITVKDDGDFDFPNGSVLVKTFSIGGKRIETRLFVRHDDGGWAGYTYEWLDDESDAVLLAGSKSKRVGAQTWHYPSRSECVRCHTAPAGRTLGPELGQLNGDFTYASTNRISNQLKTLEHISVLDKPLGKPVDQIIAYPDPFGAAPVEARARSYMHSNCSHCHRQDGGGRGNMVLTFGTALKDTITCNVDPEAGDLGIAGAKLIVPGDPAKSLVSVRPHALDANRMPPIASSVVDDQGTALLDDWIRSLTACP